ncbi:alpha-ketoacid dehydrogenase subunit beta [Paludibacterium paludis]|uniref:Acetoin dehydrogenase n=1 Tax=Paludibacterium paludis TaxID=1225769 RepID=A0A918P6U5_9NEIS|nr:transketolase C-terminal domain-containing protein [Paludibacterium paludis]GGY28042.1 acetoin dehydrogenase [Paludibacterium paludis]
MSHTTMNAATAINRALHLAMEQDERTLCLGLGVDDPKAIFGTTTGLQERFGAERVFDTPTSENAMTGIAIGAALAGMRPVMCHQRLDFFLLALDQLVNNAAKWHYTFDRPVPLTIRLIMGRGWGQGPTHAQNLQSWFAHVPGLKVVMPSSAADAKGLLLSSIFDDDPVVFLEHRWLHFAQGEVPDGDVRVPLGRAAVLREGDAVTIVAMSYMTVEALHACRALESAGIACELIDLRTVRPIDWPAIFASVRHTGRLLALDTGAQTGSVAGEIVARVAMECWGDLKAPPARLALPDCPEPTSYGLTRHFYPGAEAIMLRIGQMLGIERLPLEHLPERHAHHDVPGSWFSGPF